MDLPSAIQGNIYENAIFVQTLFFVSGQPFSRVTYIAHTSVFQRGNPFFFLKIEK